MICNLLLELLPPLGLVCRVHAGCGLVAGPLSPDGGVCVVLSARIAIDWMRPGWCRAGLPVSGGLRLPCRRLVGCLGGRQTSLHLRLKFSLLFGLPFGLLGVRQRGRWEKRQRGGRQERRQATALSMLTGLGLDCPRWLVTSLPDYPKVRFWSRNVPLDPRWRPKRSDPWCRWRLVWSLLSIVDSNPSVLVYAK